MAATIYIDVDDLTGRLGELSAWTRAGDRVLVTRGGYPIFHLLPTTGTGETLTSVGVVSPGVPPAGRRPLGTHPGALTISPNFNEPADWDGSPLPRAGS